MNCVSVLERIRCILSEERDLMHLKESSVKRSGESDENEAGSKRQDTGELKVEDLLQRIAHLEGENKSMSDKLEKIRNEIQCSVCFETSDEDVVLQKCGHNFCKPCFVRWNGSGQRNSNTCPTCRTAVAQNSVCQHRAFRRIADSLRTEKVYPDGRQYTGEFKDGKANGKGTMTWTNPSYGKSRRYEGEFLDDLPHGQGKMRILHNVHQGHGLPLQERSEVYEGEFRRGKYHGQGKLVIDGHVWEGQFSNDMSNGKTTHTWPNGNVCVGNYVNGLLRGDGTMFFANGDKYVGELSYDGKKKGQGTLFYANGTKYIGEFDYDKKHGKGRMEYPDGHVETASWYEDEPCDDEVFEFFERSREP